MKRLGIVIAAAAMLLSGQAMAASGSKGPAPIDKKSHDAGMAEAPAAVQAANLACTVQDAYLINTIEDKKAKTKTSFYEVACGEGLGYLVQNGSDGKAAAFDCLSINGQAADDEAAGKKGSITCILPGNADAKMGLVPLIKAAGATCTPSNARAMGATPAGDAYFEVSCAEGSGVVLQTSRGKPPTTSPCAAFIGGATECKLTTPEQVNASIASMAAKSGKACTMSQFRYVGSTSSGSTYYEVACGSSPGFMMEANASGAFASAIDCAKAQSVAGGCTLTDTSQAEQAETATYTRLAKANAYPCEVAKYRFLGVDKASNSEVVELACSNRPDGAVALFPVDKGAGKAVILDCLQAGGLGASCALSQPSALYGKYTQAIASKKANATCKVSGARWLAQTSAAKTDLIETACSDGLPGFVVEVDRSGQVASLMTCGEAQRAGAACSLPTNTAKK